MAKAGAGSFSETGVRRALNLYPDKYESVKWKTARQERASLPPHPHTGTLKCNAAPRPLDTRKPGSMSQPGGRIPEPPAHSQPHLQPGCSWGRCECSGWRGGGGPDPHNR